MDKIENAYVSFIITVLKGCEVDQRCFHPALPYSSI